MFDLTPPDEVASRIRQLQEKMGDRGVDLVVLLQNVDLFYFTGTIQRGYLAIPIVEEPVFFVQKDYERAVRESPLRCIKLESLKEIPNRLRERGITGKRIGMELDVIPVTLFRKLHGLMTDWEIVDISHEIEEIRSIKSDFEIRQIKRSGKIVDHVFSEVKNHLREGMSEIELDGVLTSIGRAVGHQGFLRMRGFNREIMTIHVLTGDSGSITTSSDTVLGGYGTTPAVAQGSSTQCIRRDQPILIDYGGGYNGYVTDETRLFVMGKLKDRLKKAYGVALGMTQEIESLARAGEQPETLYERTLAIANREGLGAHFMGYGEGQVNFVGHGLGLEVNEWPVLRHGEKKPLQSGMVFAFEPKFVFPGEDAVGIELDYVVKDHGLERVTSFPKEIVVL